MAAKPSQPPGGSLLNRDVDDSDNISTQTAATNRAATETNNNIYNSNNSGSSGNSNTRKNSNNNNSNENIALESADAHTPKPNCSCTNISIMHLFHEMKQEFPTIPDTIVAQCVNENCHQRESCVQMLRNELALNPIPAQSYPAKVLHQQRQLQQQLLLQQQSNLQNKQKPPKPLKPTRLAPLLPHVNDTNTISPHVVNSNVKDKLFSKPAVYPLASQQNCDSRELVANANGSSRSASVPLKDVRNSNCAADNSDNSSGVGVGESAASAMPVTTARAAAALRNVADTPTNQQNCVNETTAIANLNGSSNTTTTPLPPPIQPPRARPTTLNLQSPEQRQQQQQLNVQLQKHFQQRNQLLQKPVRKAPLPPIPPKPSQFNSPATQSHHGSSSSHSSQQSSFSTESSLTSPISSGESEISVNVSLSSPTTPAHQQQQLKSPIRHRSVITVQPEAPYTRDFLVSPTASSPGSGSVGQKSFTSVNLTLRQPTSSSLVPQSTIDISAGPGVSGTGSRLTYSSTSYDARRGFQKNFHITVTDQGGVFSASRIRPRSCYGTDGEQEEDGPVNGNSGGINPLRSAASEDNVSEQRSYAPIPQQRQQQYNAISNHSQCEDMCMARESNGFCETLQRQKTRRDKLATVLRDNKKRLGQLEEEINVLTVNVNPGESERLDSDIQRLRCDCHAMLNELENARRGGPSVACNQSFGSGQHELQQQQQQQQTYPQPFPRQRPPRPPPPQSNTLARAQPQLDFVQRHSSSAATTPTTPPFNPPHYPHQLLQPQQQHPRITTSYQQYQPQHSQTPYQTPPQTYVPPSTDEDEYSDSNTDGGEDDDEEPLEMWACNMCTFRNHPQLNICECCENVRILPGTIPFAPTAAASAASAPAAGLGAATTNSNPSTPANGNASIENDANLTQQQLQQFALHT